METPAESNETLSTTNLSEYYLEQARINRQRASTFENQKTKNPFNSAADRFELLAKQVSSESEKNTPQGDVTT